MLSLLWFILLVLLVLWAVGLFAANWGSIVWLFLVAAAVVLIFNLFTGTRSGRWY
jgi:Family of unknown function (DUF5670)